MNSNSPVSGAPLPASGASSACDAVAALGPSDLSIAAAPLPPHPSHTPQLSCGPTGILPSGVLPVSSAASASAPALAAAPAANVFGQPLKPAVASSTFLGQAPSAAPLQPAVPSAVSAVDQPAAHSSASDSCSTPLHVPPSQPAVLRISGATGIWAEIINGFFAATQEKGSDGRVVYGKCGDASVCIEHRAGRWEVKPVSDKGSTRLNASVAGGCALEACASRVWRVGNGSTFEDQASVKIATGPDVEREVSGCCMRPQQRTTTPAPL